MRSLIVALGLLAGACTGTGGNDEVRLNVADLCTQAGNAEAALATQITAGKFYTEGQEKAVMDAKVTADAFCLDQSWTASAPERVTKLRSVVPVLVSLAFPE